jgi:H-type lectin domain
MEANMQTGAFNFGQGTHPSEWFLHSGSGERTFHTTIKFGVPFNTPPQVAVAVTGVDASNAANLRINMTTQDIQTDEFDLVVGTWADSLIYAIYGVWVAG